MSTSSSKISRARGRAPLNGVTPKSSRARRRKYERTTPVGRVRKNLEKARRTLELVSARLRSWEAAEEKQATDLGMAQVAAEEATGAVDKALAYVTSLEKASFAPKKRSSAVVFSVEDQVRISDKHRDRYLAVYPEETLSHLVVAKVLPTGEIAVKHGKMAFIVPKSHLARRAAE